jgi:hypothetical protein
MVEAGLQPPPEQVEQDDQDSIDLHLVVSVHGPPPAHAMLIDGMV